MDGEDYNLWYGKTLINHIKKTGGKWPGAETVKPHNFYRVTERREGGTVGREIDTGNSGIDVDIVRYISSPTPAVGGETKRILREERGLSEKEAEGVLEAVRGGMVETNDFGGFYIIVNTEKEAVVGIVKMSGSTTKDEKELKKYGKGVTVIAELNGVKRDYTRGKGGDGKGAYAGSLLRLPMECVKYDCIHNNDLVNILSNITEVSACCTGGFGRRQKTGGELDKLLYRNKNGGTVYVLERWTRDKTGWKTENWHFRRDFEWADAKNFLKRWDMERRLRACESRKINRGMF